MPVVMHVPSQSPPSLLQRPHLPSSSLFPLPSSLFPLSSSLFPLFSSSLLLSSLISCQDAPRHAWRGVMVDTARHFMPVDTVLLPHIRAMAINKVRISERRTASPPPPPVPPGGVCSAVRIVLSTCLRCDLSHCTVVALVVSTNCSVEY